ncbi:AAA family ATPase [Leptospira sp. 201903071]|uniref:ATP-binding protein n=1 Tax=Leptospira ainazelensis TaxID=2810034 RepID=UPI001963FC11|nr:ATP-binding protein [Leptospira ainazelensis]MBM9500274.1 AAA family ATPase [Leptospira ainazelensis]
MLIRKLVIENYKSLKGRFTIEFNSGINILVGDNEAGKSTILEALHLVLTGLLHGKYLKNELTQYIFNDEVINEYIENLEKGSLPIPPAILMEVFLIGDDLAILEGDANSDKKKDCGISLKIAFDEKFQDEYCSYPT